MATCLSDANVEHGKSVALWSVSRKTSLQQRFVRRASFWHTNLSAGHASVCFSIKRFIHFLPLYNQCAYLFLAFGYIVSCLLIFSPSSSAHDLLRVFLTLFVYFSPSSSVVQRRSINTADKYRYGTTNATILN